MLLLDFEQTFRSLKFWKANMPSLTWITFWTEVLDTWVSLVIQHVFSQYLTGGRFKKKSYLSLLLINAAAPANTAPRTNPAPINEADKPRAGISVTA